MNLMQWLFSLTLVWCFVVVPAIGYWAMFLDYKKERYNVRR